MPGHNSSLFVLGVMILWFGWYGFNPGSQLALVGYSQAIANAAVTTTIAPASSALSALLVKAALGKIQLGACGLLSGAQAEDALQHAAPHLLDCVACASCCTGTLRPG